MSRNQEAMSFVMALSTLESRLARSFDQQLGLHGISYREFLVLHHLQQAPGHTLRRGELAERVSLSASGITRMLRPMEKIGLVEKETSPRDARVSLVRLSDTGATICDDASKTFSEGAASAMKPLTAGKIAECRELLGQIIRQ
jgi:DNA-binding MarR family transcriptional regulator